MRVVLDMNQDNDKLDFLTGQQFDQINVCAPAENSAFMAALKELTPDMMKKLNIDVVTGTMVRIAIVNNDSLWDTYKSKMIEAVERLESIVKSTVESQQGILVKIIHDSFICFFPDRNRVRSSIFRSIYSACKLRSELEDNPIYLDDGYPSCECPDGDQCRNAPHTLQIVVFLSYGSAYRRSLHIQRKILHDYYGEIVDNILTAANEHVNSTLLMYRAHLS